MLFGVSTLKRVRTSSDSPSRCPSRPKGNSLSIRTLTLCSGGISSVPRVSVSTRRSGTSSCPGRALLTTGIEHCTTAITRSNVFRRLRTAVWTDRPRAAQSGRTDPTILRWDRTLVAQKYDGSKRRPGRPTTKPDIAALVVRMANENPTWGYTRIRGALKHLGHDLARNTIKAILKDHGIEPAPERRTKMPWKTFLAAHWDALAAADFFTVEVLTMAGWSATSSCSS